MKRVLLVLALCVLPSLARAQVVDHFTDADGTRLNAHSAFSGGTGFWSETTGTWTIQTNRATCSLFTSCLAARPETFPNDQSASVLTEGKTTDTPIVGVILRSSGTTYYHCAATKVGAGVDILVYRTTAGVSTYLVQYTSGVLPDVTFTLLCAVAGQNTSTAITVSANGTPIGSYTDNDPAAINSGKPGLFLNTNGGMPTLDDFSCTAASASSARPSIIGGGVF